MGFGFKYYLKENMYVGIEVLHRKLFTDYIDDVSTGYIDPDYFQYLLIGCRCSKSKTDYIIAERMQLPLYKPW